MMASAVAPMSPAASAALMTRERTGWRSSGARVAPAVSHEIMISTIMAASRATLAVASVTAVLDKRLLAETAAIATQALGVAAPRNSPPGNGGACAPGA